MAGEPGAGDPEGVSHPFPAVADLAERRRQAERTAASVAAAPVRFLPAELLEALQGSWGTPEELGVAPARERRLRAVGD